MKDNIPDIAMLVGFLMVGRGLFLIYPPMMWVGCGIGLIYFGWPKRAVKK